MKPLIKKSNKFKEKIKSFFNFDIEKDLQEEESTKVFEKIPLVTLTRTKIFLAIFLFLVIVNCLVGFDINYFYIRAILGFIFLITIPGLLIMLCFKIRTVKFWEYLVYTVGLSISFIMFAGLAVNWTLPALNITDKPLSLWPILICFDIFLIALGIVAWIRNKDFQSFKLTVPKLDWLNNIFFIIPMTFPVLAVLGAFLLNNHGSNILTMIMLGGIAVYVLLLTIFRKRMNENIWPWALWMIGLALLLMYSMRSNYLVGSDVQEEFKMFSKTIIDQYWNPNSIRNAYNSMLSITILPSIIYHINKITPFFIFKIFSQILFSFLAVIIFIELNKKVNKIFSFITCIFFISQTQFISYSGWIRQEIALVFFGLMLLVLFYEEINKNIKKIFFLIFGVSMIVSHYSTSYIALALFTLTYIMTFFYKRYENKRIKKGKLNLKKKTEFCLTGILVLLLLLVGFLWLSQITESSGGLVDFVHNSIINLQNVLSEENRQEGQSLLDQINIFYKTPNPLPLVQQYGDYVSTKYQSDTSLRLYDNTSKSIKLTGFNVPVPIISLNIFNKLSSITEPIKKIIRLFLCFGFFILLFLMYKKKINLESSIFTLIFTLIFILIIILPFSSMSYNMGRLYQQSLILISFPTILGMLFISNVFTKKNIYIYTAIIVLIYFLLSVGFFYAFTNSQDSPIHLTNFGSPYSVLYVYESEFNAINWLDKNIILQNRVYADPMADFRIKSLSGMNNRVIKDVLPTTIDRNSYIYSSYMNSVLNKGFLPSINNYLKRLNIIYEFPTEFLNDNKNKIYNNGGSEIFK